MQPHPQNFSCRRTQCYLPYGGWNSCLPFLVKQIFQILRRALNRKCTVALISFYLQMIDRNSTHHKEGNPEFFCMKNFEGVAALVRVLHI